MVMKIKIFLLLLLIFFSNPASAAIENIENAGFVPGPIWFSKYPVFVDDEVKIFTALYNNSQYNISAELHFFNNEKQIGKTNIELPAGSGTQDVSIEWVAEKGDIEISAEIKNVSAVNSQDEVVEQIDFSDTQVAKSKVFIDSDNDEDGIGNVDDDDDDNDGVSDLDEIAEGSDPFMVDHVISTSSDKSNEIELSNDQTVEKMSDKLDQSVVGFLNKVTNNKIDQIVDSIGGEKIDYLSEKKEEIENRLGTSGQKLDTIKSQQSVLDGQEHSPRELKELEAKSKMSIFFSNILPKAYLFFLSILIFLLKHPFFLFIAIFFLIFIVIKRIFKFYTG